MDSIAALISVLSFIVICFILTIFLIWLKGRCKHEWEAVQKVAVDTHGANDYDRIYLRCKKCGDVKCKEMR